MPLHDWRDDRGWESLHTFWQTQIVDKDANEVVKKFLKDGLTEDSAKSAETDIQNLTNDFTGKVEKHLEVKEKEIMTV